MTSAAPLLSCTLPPRSSSVVAPPPPDPAVTMLHSAAITRVFAANRALRVSTVCLVVSLVIFVRMSMILIPLIVQPASEPLTTVSAAFGFLSLGALVGTFAAQVYYRRNSAGKQFFWLFIASSAARILTDWMIG